ncbi:DegV family protein [Lacticaseibacillus sp. GG6-2]
MTTIKLVTDSSVQLTDAEIAKYHIHVIPLTVMIDNTIYIDGETISRTEFMTKMAAAKTLPKTSQPPIGRFLETYNALTADGSEVLSVHMLAGLSGTVNAAHQAAEMADGQVTVIDSDFLDRALSFQLIEAAKMIADGAAMPEILAKMALVRARTKVMLAVDNLDNLVKGGRLSRAAGALGSLLNIKVILEVANGQLSVLQKGRGKKTIHRFTDGLLAQLTQTEHLEAVGISFAGSDTYPQTLATKLRAAIPNLPVVVRPTSPVIATHTGEGAFAVMYYTH